MAGQLPAVLSCAVTIGLLGLAEFLRPWGLTAQFWKGFKWAHFVVLLLFLIASLVGFGAAYAGTRSTQVPLCLLLGTYWVYGRWIQGLFLWRTGNRICRVLAIVCGCAGAIQFAGIVISSAHWLTKDKAKWVTSAGVIVFVLAFHFFGIGFALYRHRGSIKRYIVVFSVLWMCVAAGTIAFHLIPDEVWFYLAHCFFLCVELLAVLLFQVWANWRLGKKPNRGSTFGNWQPSNELVSIQDITPSNLRGQVATTFLRHTLTDDSQSTKENSPPVTPVTDPTVPPSAGLALHPKVLETTNSEWAFMNEQTTLDLNDLERGPPGTRLSYPSFMSSDAPGLRPCSSSRNSESSEQDTGEVATPCDWKTISVRTCIEIEHNKQPTLEQTRPPTAT